MRAPGSRSAGTAPDRPGPRAAVAGPVVASPVVASTPAPASRPATTPPAPSTAILPTSRIPPPCRPWSIALSRPIAVYRLDDKMYQRRRCITRCLLGPRRRDAPAGTDGRESPGHALRRRHGPTGGIHAAGSDRAVTATPERESLALLPSGPDAVRTLSVRGTRSVNTTCAGPHPDEAAPRTAFGPAWSGFRVQGTAISPPSATGRLEGSSLAARFRPRRRTRRVREYRSDVSADEAVPVAAPTAGTES